MLSIFSDLPLTRQTEKNVYFLILMMKLTKTSILPSFQVPNSLFWAKLIFVLLIEIVSSPHNLYTIILCFSTLAELLYLLERQVVREIAQALMT